MVVPSQVTNIYIFISGWLIKTFPNGKQKKVHLVSTFKIFCGKETFKFLVNDAWLLRMRLLENFPFRGKIVEVEIDLYSIMSYEQFN